MSGHTADAERFLDEAEPCNRCGTLHDEDYCPVCEEFDPRPENETVDSVRAI